MPTTKDIFGAMPSRFDPAAAGDWSSVMVYKIAPSGDDPGGEFTVTVQNGTCEVKEGAVDNPSVVFDTDAETFVGISTGTMDGQTAFFSGKLRIEGNMADAMKVNSVFKRE